jgi:hypothetical protein
MEILKYLINKKLYLLINIIILLIGYYCIDKGNSMIKSDASSSNIYVSIGTSLIAAGIVIFLDLWKKLSINKITEKIKNIINESGIQWVSKKRDLDKYDVLVENLKDSLDICGYSLGGFFDSFSDTIKSKDNIKVRVLFVDPDSDAAKQRAEIEGKSVVLFKEKFETFKKHFKDVDSVVIKKINIPLSTMIYRIDDVMFIGPHFYKKQSKSTLTIELAKSKWLFDEYQQEFNRMWDDASPI